MLETILITGANRGIGLALVYELLTQGHTVVATCRAPDAATELRELESKLHGQLTVVRLDVDSETSAGEAAGSLATKLPHVDVLINNAAIFPSEGNESILDIDLQFFRAAFETNVLGVIRVTRAFLPFLRKSKNPRIINISSGAGSITDKDDSSYYDYSTSKAALNMVTRAMAAEFKPEKITIVALSPGWVQTEMGGPNAQITPQESAGSIAKTIEGLSLAKTSRFLDRDGSDIELRVVKQFHHEGHEEHEEKKSQWRKATAF